MKLCISIFCLTFSSALSIGLALSPAQEAPPVAPRPDVGSKECGYKSFPDNTVVEYEGDNIKSSFEQNVNNCKQKCTDTNDCNSFSYCDYKAPTGLPNCHLKTKIVDPVNDQRKRKSSCKTYYPRSCKTPLPGGCTCSDFIDPSSGYGQCKKNYKHRPVCYVNEPSTCTDLQYGESTQRSYSWEACNLSPPPCEDDNNWRDYDEVTGGTGDGKSTCDDMSHNFCFNKGTYSTYVQKACPRTCGLC